MPEETAPPDVEDALAELETMPAELHRRAAESAGDAARRKPAAGVFSFLENVWHLADLEREGFGARIRRLRTEESPRLPDFDGARLARERSYNERDLAAGLAAFASARRENLAVLRGLGEREWERAGEQDGVGRVRLRDVPFLMLEHDRSHRREIEELFSGFRAAGSR